MPDEIFEVPAIPDEQATPARVNWYFGDDPHHKLHVVDAATGKPPEGEDITCADQAEGWYDRVALDADGKPEIDPHDPCRYVRVRVHRAIRIVRKGD